MAAPAARCSPSITTAFYTTPVPAEFSAPVAQSWTLRGSGIKLLYSIRTGTIYMSGIDHIMKRGGTSTTTVGWD